MNIFNLKRQVAGYMLMCGGGGSESGGNAGNAEDGGGSSSFTDESGQTYQSNNGQPMYGSDSSSSTDEGGQSYQSNDGQPMYGADAATPNEAPAQTMNYQNFGMPSGETVTNPAELAYAKDMTDAEKSARAIVGKTPVLGQLASTVEGLGKFVQPGGSILKKGEVGGYGGSGSSDERYIDEDGNPIAKIKKPGLINSAIDNMTNNSGDSQQKTQSEQQQKQPQQSYTAPQAATPTNAGGSVDASMYGSGTGWGASIAKFTKAKQGVTL